MAQSTSTQKTTIQGGYVYAGDILLGQVRQDTTGQWYGIHRTAPGVAPTRHYAPTRAQAAAKLR